MRYTKQMKADVSQALERVSEILHNTVKDTDLYISVSVGQFHDDDEAAIFISDKRGGVVLHKCDEIKTVFDSDKWRNRRACP